jgi:hypothetical protein
MLSRCDSCGNEQNRTFEIRMARKLYTFDTLKCAIQVLAPTCTHCGDRILGHPVRLGLDQYCSAECAQAVAQSAQGEQAAL